MSLIERQPDFTIRRARREDATVLATLRGLLFRETGRGAAPDADATFLRLCADAFVDVVDNDDCIAWLAEADGEAIGVAVLLIFPRLPSPRSLGRWEGHLSTVYTRPDWRHRGVATALVRAAVVEGRERGLARLRLHATAAGQPIYAAAGFASRSDEMELLL